MSVFPAPRTPGSRRSAPRTPGPRTPGPRTPAENVIGQIEVSTPAPRSARWATPLATPLATPCACSTQRPQFSPFLFDTTPRPNFELNPQEIQSPISAASPGFSFGPQQSTPSNSMRARVPHLPSYGYAAAGATDIHIVPRMSDAGDLMMHENDLTIVRRMNERFPDWYAIIYDLFNNLIVPEDAKICINYLQLLSFIIGFKLLTTRNSIVPKAYGRLEWEQITYEKREVFITEVFRLLSEKIKDFDRDMQIEYNAYVSQIIHSNSYRQAIGQLGVDFLGDDAVLGTNEEFQDEEFEGGSSRRRRRRRQHHRVKTIKKSHKKSSTARRRRSSKARSTRRR